MTTPASGAGTLSSPDRYRRRPSTSPGGDPAVTRSVPKNAATAPTGPAVSIRRLAASTSRTVRPPASSDRTTSATSAGSAP